MDDNGKLLYQAKDLVANLSKIGEVVEGLDRLEELVQKQQAKDNPNRAGVKTNKYRDFYPINFIPLHTPVLLCIPILVVLFCTRESSCVVAVFNVMSSGRCK